MNNAKQLFENIPGKNQKLVVISDLHLGDTRYIDGQTHTSVLDKYTHYPRSGPNETWVVREGHLDSFLERLEHAKNEVAPTDSPFDFMILLGDIFDTSLATFQETIANVQAFLDGVERSGLVKAFVYIPGNHDHHFWQMINESYGIAQTVQNWPQNGDPTKILPGPHHKQTDLAYDNSFLNALTGLPLHIVSPNALCKYNDGQTVYVFHHGHLFSKAFILVSEIFEKLFEKVKDLEELEALNAGWTELGWFHIGQTKSFGEKVEVLYNQIRKGDEDAQQRIATVIDEQWKNLFKNMHWAYRWAVKGYATPSKWFVKHKLTNILKRKSETPGASDERNIGIVGMMDVITQYMTHIVNLYDLHENMDVRLVFGHTHLYDKYTPNEPIDIAGKKINLSVYNCGAWQEADDQNNRLLTIDASGELVAY